MTTWDDLKALLGVGAEEQSPIPQTVTPEAPIPLTTERPMRLEGGTAPPPMIQEPKIDPASLRQNMQPAPEPIVEPAIPKLRDYEREAIDDKNSFSNKLLEALIGGLAGAGGRGIGEITNARMIRENSKLREAKQMNLRSPDSQISGHFRELAKMYSDPKEFTVTPQMSAEDIMEAMPWLKGKIGLDMNQQKLDYSTRSRTGGSGLPKKRPLGEKPLEAITVNESLQEQLGKIKSTISSNPELIGKMRSIGERAKTSLGLQDPQWAALNTEIGVLRNYIARAIQGGVLSDRDNALYERLVTGMDTTPEAVVSVLDSLGKTAQIKTDEILNVQERGGRDVSGFSDMRDRAKSASKSELTVKLSVNGKIGEIPASKLKDFMKKYPNAKRVK